MDHQWKQFIVSHLAIRERLLAYEHNGGKNMEPPYLDYIDFSFCFWHKGCKISDYWMPAKYIKKYNIKNKTYTVFTGNCTSYFLQSVRLRLRSILTQWLNIRIYTFKMYFSKLAFKPGRPSCTSVYLFLHDSITGASCFRMSLETTTCSNWYDL